MKDAPATAAGTADTQAALEQAEAKARYYQNQYEFLARQIPGAMFVFDVDGDRIIEANQAACELLGYSREKLTSTIRISDIHPHELPLFQAFSQEVVQNESAATEKLSCMTSAGRYVPVRVHATLYQDESGRKLIRAIVVDKLAEEAAEQALQDEVKARYNYEEIIGRSGTLDQVLHQVALVAPTDASVLILGETGTGKELICRAIHHSSPRRVKPLVKVNCAAIPAGLIESELFGHEKGAFTGAIAQKRGRFELAHGGTIFLDEVGDLPLETQPKLLRVLQEQEVERLGSTRTIRINTRVIAATHRDLRRMVKEERFREDLFYRLNIFPILLPALRERREDIPMLANYFAQRKSIPLGKPPCQFSEAAMQRLVTYAWPGNVRELENIIERAVILCPNSTIQAEHVQVDVGASPVPDGAVRRLIDVERDHILAALEATNWKVSDKGGTAELLGFRPTTLESRMKKLGINRSANR
jgi:formate hydrogenlyase transcriptional activator